MGAEIQHSIVTEENSHTVLSNLTLAELLVRVFFFYVLILY